MEGINDYNRIEYDRIHHKEYFTILEISKRTNKIHSSCIVKLTNSQFKVAKELLDKKSNSNKKFNYNIINTKTYTIGDIDIFVNFKKCSLKTYLNNK